MTSPRKTLHLLALIVFCVMPQLYAMATRTEFFPWSPFPMYSGLNTGESYLILSAFAVDKDGSELPIEEAMLVRPKYEYRDRLDAEDLWTRELSPDEGKTLKRFADIFQEDLKKSERSFVKVRFYLEFWKNFEGPRHRTPDERRLIFEQNLEQ